MSQASAAFGLATSAIWGCSDFLGGFASKRAHVAHVAWMGGAVASLALAALALALREPLPAPVPLAWAALAGLAGGIGLVTFYHALATGRMGLVAPLTAVTFAALPVLAAMASEGLPPPLRSAGFVLAFGGIILVSRRPGEGQGSLRSMALAILAGALFALFVTLLHKAGAQGSDWWALAVAKTSSTLVPLVWVVLLRPPVAGLATARVPAIAAGLLDATGNATILAGMLAGSRAVAVVLGSFYPAVTTLLAWAVLKERLQATQGAGAALLAASVPCIMGG